MLFSKIGNNKESLELKLKPTIQLRVKPSITLNRINWDGSLVDTESIKDFSYPFKQLNPIQSEFYANRFLDNNFIISARTSAGKTIVAELAKNGKFLYLSPLKAISQEKYDDWTSPEHTWSNLNIAISTGDYQLTPNRVQEMRDADVIIMTSEMLDSRTRSMQQEKSDWLCKIKTLVIDEFHLCGYKGRGDKLESALVRFTELNPNCRLICLSATMPNIEELGIWLTKLNGKETTIINSEYRPVTLHRHYESYISYADYEMNEYEKINKVVKILNARPNDKFIVFVHTKNTGRKIQELLKDMNIPCEFHNADLGKEERIKLQNEFNSKEKGSLRILIATSTLAWGVNTPADSVIICGVHRGQKNLIENQDIHQMCGRAGRVGKATNAEGHAFILLPNKDFESFRTWCDKISDIKSQMQLQDVDGIQTLCFHIIAEILNNRVYDAQSLDNWYSRTLASHQNVEMGIENAQIVLDKLKELSMIMLEDNRYYVTGLGKVSAYMYYSPFDIYSWYRNFKYLSDNKIPHNPVTLSWALANNFSNNIGYIPSQAAVEANIWNRLLNRHSMDGSYVAHIGAAYHHLLIGTEQYPYSLFVYKRQIQMDAGRILTAIKMIDNFYGRWNYEQLWERLRTQVQYGVKEHLLELVSLPQIGAKRAENLYKAGIRNKQDFINKGNIARSIVTSKLYESILKTLK